MGFLICAQLYFQEEGDEGDEAGMWDKEGDVGEDNSQKISKKDALPLVVQWYVRYSLINGL
jgi:hypothetical protein